VFVTETGHLDGPRYVINFPTKKHWRAPSQLAYIDAGLTDLIRVLRDLNIKSVAVPPSEQATAAWNGQTSNPDWSKPLEQVPDIRAIIYPPGAGTRAIRGLDGLRMTWGRAVLLEALRRYLDQRRAMEP
jgi:O-acetyl-ADP-ribose deacetylase (regulator of RNase III)